MEVEKKQTVALEVDQDRGLPDKVQGHCAFSDEASKENQDQSLDFASGEHRKTLSYSSMGWSLVSK